MVAGAIPRRSPLRGMAGKFFFEPSHVGRLGISLKREWRNGDNRFSGEREKRREADAGGLTERRKAFSLKELNRSCPELGNVLRFVFVARTLY